MMLNAFASLNASLMYKSLSVSCFRNLGVFPRLSLMVSPSKPLKVLDRGMKRSSKLISSSWSSRKLAEKKDRDGWSRNEGLARRTWFNFKPEEIMSWTLLHVIILLCLWRPFSGQLFLYFFLLLLSWFLSRRWSYFFSFWPQDVKW